MLRKKLVINFVLILFLQTSQAASCVSSLDDLKDALENANRGDVIKICNGEYEKWQWTMAGEEVTVEAETPGEVNLHNDAFVKIEGKSNRLNGVYFHGGGSTTVINIQGDFNTVSDCMIKHHDAHHWVNIEGVGNTIQKCWFSDKTALSYDGSSAGQQLIQSKVSVDSHDNNILNNVFMNYEYEDGVKRGNGYETLQIRDPEDTHDGKNLVKGNYFYRCNVETEVISVKCNNNILTDNAFEENIGSLTLRAGHSNIVAKNVWNGHFLEGTMGVRIMGKHHVVEDNWFMRLTDDAMIVYAGEEGHEAAQNITLQSNTVVDSETGIHLGSSYEDPPIEPIRIIQNTVSNNDGLLIIEDEFPGVEYTFKDNFLYGSNLGWEEDIPDGIHYEEDAIDLGEEGDNMLLKIKCSAGPSWNKLC